MAGCRTNTTIAAFARPASPGLTLTRPPNPTRLHTLLVSVSLASPPSTLLPLSSALRAPNGQTSPMKNTVLGTSKLSPSQGNRPKNRSPGGHASALTYGRQPRYYPDFVTHFCARAEPRSDAKFLLLVSVLYKSGKSQYGRLAKRCSVAEHSRFFRCGSSHLSFAALGKRGPCSSCLARDSIASLRRNIGFRRAITINAPLRA